MGSIRWPKHNVSLLVSFAFTLLIFSSALGGEEGNGGESKNKNFIRNGSFEEVKADGTPVDWGICIYGSVEEQEKLDTVLAKTWSITTEKAHTGKRSFKIDLTSVDSSDEFPRDKGVCLLWGQSLKSASDFLRGKEVLLTVWVYCEYIPDTPSFGPYFKIRIKTPSGVTAPLYFIINPGFLESQGYLSFEEKIGKWIKVEKKGRIPLETVLDLQCPLLMKLRGENNLICIYIDDISLKVIEPEN